MKTRRIVNDTSFERFVKELVFYTRTHPDCEVTGCKAGDNPKAEDDFMFSAAIEYNEGGN